MIVSDAELRKILSELDYLKPDDLKRAEATAASESMSLYDALLKLDLLSDQDLGKLIAYSIDVPYASLAQATIPDEILKIAPQEVAEKYKVITFANDDKGLKIATSNPKQSLLFSMLAKKAGTKDFKVFYATDHDIDDALHLYRKELQSVFDELFAPNEDGKAQVGPSVASIIDTMIEYAYASRASDVHIEPTRSGTLVRFRIDGVLHDTVKLPKTLREQLVNRIKVLARLRTDEHFSAQDGRLRLAIKEGENVDIRVSIVPIMAGEKVVMRLLSSHFRQFGLTDLGMSEADLEKVQKGFRRPYGMVLSTGPTGSGKTTSMYAILKILNTRDKNIATIEDPVEYEIEGLNQIQANKKTNLTFANGLRSILRQDPNIIYVGEIRDEETADIAINSALTGHLVLSTLHTNNAATTLPRLIDMKVEPFLVASTINVIIGQRLVRKICDRCKVSFELTKTKDAWKGDEQIAARLLTLPSDLIAKYLGSDKSVRVYRGKGCSVCHQTGYVGRIGVFEVLEVSPEIEALIVAKADAEKIMDAAVSEGMTTMLQDGLSKVQRGLTTIEEVMRVTRE